MSADAVEQFEHAGCLVRIHYDDDAESPRQWDNLGHMICWHSRYILGDMERGQRHPETHDGTVCSQPSDFQEWWKENGEGGLLIGLSLLDHSGLHMYAGHSAHWSDSAGWDSGPVGWIYVTREMLLKEHNAKRVSGKMRQTAERCLRSEVETYDEYLSGQVYGYVVSELLPADEDSDSDSLDDREGDELDSCWGFYGLDYCREQAKEIAEHHAKKVKS